MDLSSLSWENLYGKTVLAADISVWKLVPSVKSETYPLTR